GEAGRVPGRSSQRVTRARGGGEGLAAGAGEGAEGAGSEVDPAVEEGEFRSERSPIRHDRKDVIVGQFQTGRPPACFFASHKWASPLYTGRSCTPGASSCPFLERALFPLRINE